MLVISPSLAARARSRIRRIVTRTCPSRNCNAAEPNFSDDEMWADVRTACHLISGGALKLRNSLTYFKFNRKFFFICKLLYLKKTVLYEIYRKFKLAWKPSSSCRRPMTTGIRIRLLAADLPAKRPKIIYS